MKAEGDPAGKPTKEALIINAPTVRGHYSRRRQSLRRTPHPDIPFKNTIIESGEEAGAVRNKKTRALF